MWRRASTVAVEPGTERGGIVGEKGETRGGGRDGWEIVVRRVGCEGKRDVEYTRKTTHPVESSPTPQVHSHSPLPDRIRRGE